MENITAKVSCFARAYHDRNNTTPIFADTAAGFLVYEHLDHAEMTDQYFSDYNQRNPEHSMKAPAGVCYILAVRQKTEDRKNEPQSTCRN